MASFLRKRNGCVDAVAACARDCASACVRCSSADRRLTTGARRSYRMWMNARAQIEAHFIRVPLWYEPVCVLPPTVVRSAARTSAPGQKKKKGKAKKKAG